MSSFDFRQIALRRDAGKAERLFRAAVTAFCSLTRPSRREIGQLEDLTLPLFPEVSTESRRFVAAALSECAYPPAALVRLLSDDPVETSAPLLIRSSALTDIDLIAIIGRHGLPHARAIAKRSELNPTVAELIRALEAVAARTDAQADADAATEPSRKEPAMPNPYPGVFAENARRRLRSMMQGSTEPMTEDAPEPAVSVYAKLRESALTGHAAFFQTVLADVLEIEFRQARRLTEASNYSGLLAALRALDLTAEEAFVIAAGIFPASFAHPEGIRLFLERFRLLHPEAAIERVRGWRAETLASSLRAPVRGPAPVSQTPVTAANQSTPREVKAG